MSRKPVRLLRRTAEGDVPVDFGPDRMGAVSGVIVAATETPTETILVIEQVDPGAA